MALSRRDGWLLCGAYAIGYPLVHAVTRSRIGWPDYSSWPAQYTHICQSSDSRTHAASVYPHSKLMVQLTRFRSYRLRTSRPGLLSPQCPEPRPVSDAENKDDHQSAMDLIDALTKSGALDVDRLASCRRRMYSVSTNHMHILIASRLSCELHVVVAATHQFDRCVVDTVCRDNVDPIHSLHRSATLMASIIHGLESPKLLLRGSP